MFYMILLSMTPVEVIDHSLSAPNFAYRFSSFLVTKIARLTSKDVAHWVPIVLRLRIAESTNQSNVSDLLFIHIKNEVKNYYYLEKYIEFNISIQIGKNINSTKSGTS